MILYVKYNNNYLGTKWYGLGYEMVWDEMTRNRSFREYNMHIQQFQITGFQPHPLGNP